jgi:hypothetical protein
MTDHENNEPFSETNLNSPEYRDRLTRKLNCLIALLEVAMARVRRSLAGPEPDVSRLTKIRANLQSTLDVCLRARTALEKHEPLPEDLPQSLSQVARPEVGEKRIPRPGRTGMPSGTRHELSSLEETKKFERMGKITDEEISGVDMDELAEKLQNL